VAAMATADSDGITTPPHDDDSSDSSVPNSPNTAIVPAAPSVCLIRFATDSAGGALMGSVFGYGFSLLFTIISLIRVLIITNSVLVFNFHVLIEGLVFMFILKMLEVLLFH
jgi:hypothetical protein